MKRLGIALVALACGACSLSLDWDVDRLKCNTDPNVAQCLPNHSCLNNVCVADGSLGEGSPCNQQMQCSAGQICAQAYIDRPCTSDATCNTCLTSCALSNAYSSVGCGSVSYCMPYCTVPSGPQGTDGTFPTCDPNNEAAACVPSNGCTPNSACALQDSSAPGVCTVMESGVTACLQACSFTYGTSLSDGCGGTTSNPSYCTPVGEPNNQQLVCVRLGKRSLLAPGSSGCDSLAAPCTPGFACIGGTCSQFCHLGTSGACTFNSAQTCTPIPGLGGSPSGITTANTGYCR